MMNERMIFLDVDGVLNNTGVYYVTVSSNGKQKTIKVIVVK